MADDDRDAAQVLADVDVLRRDPRLQAVRLDPVRATGPGRSASLGRSGSAMVTSVVSSSEHDVDGPVDVRRPGGRRRRRARQGRASCGPSGAGRSVAAGAMAWSGCRGPAWPRAALLRVVRRTAPKDSTARTRAAPGPLLDRTMEGASASSWPSSPWSRSRPGVVAVVLAPAVPGSARARSSSRLRRPRSSSGAFASWASDSRSSRPRSTAARRTGSRASRPRARVRTAGVALSHVGLVRFDAFERHRRRAVLRSGAHRRRRRRRRADEPALAPDRRASTSRASVAACPTSPLSGEEVRAMRNAGIAPGRVTAELSRTGPA